MDIKQYYKAPSLEEAYDIWKSNPKNAILGGGLWLKKLNTPIDTLVDLSSLSLEQIEETSEEIIVGALTPLREFETHPAIKAIGNGFLAQSFGSIMGVALRRQATIGGSIAGKYPFSDVITTLLTLDVVLTFYPYRDVALKDFLLEKGRLTEILTHIHIKKQICRGYFKKVANTMLDFSILNIAITSSKQAIRIAVGSRPGMATLATQAGQYLIEEKQFDEDTYEQAMKIALDELNFGTTNAGSAEYRQVLARAYIKRGLREVLQHGR